MGLLDEAIREHLELKRQQGADPDEIARKEREALEPVIPDEPGTWGADPSAELDEAFEEPGTDDAVAEPMLEDHETMLEFGGAVDFSTGGQETMEIDMREVFGESDHMAEEAYPIHRVAVAPVRAGGRITDAAVPDEFAWEVAGRAASAPAHDIPGQERLSFE